MLYNLTPAAGSLFGYKHTSEAKAKMKAHYQNKINHPMYGKNHIIETKALISKPGSSNHMFGKHIQQKPKKNIN